MKSEYLTQFLKNSEHFGILYGPVRLNDQLTYDRVDDIDSLVLSNELPMIPVKKLFHPMRFDMFRFEEEGFTPDYSMIEKRVIVGLPPCEIHGILILDLIFMKPPVDPYYALLRENSIIIGFSCLPTDNSLCKYTGTDKVNEGYDLFFVDLDDFYLVWVGSSKGHDLISHSEELFDENVTQEDIQRYIEWNQKRDRMFTREFNFSDMRDIMEMRHDCMVWDYFASKCISCGQCTMVCPTCNCYTVTDHFDVSIKNSGRRERFWDSCMFVDYSLVAGGHNFRETRADRLRLWYTHKLKAFAERYGPPGCVGCGRCVETCPVDINVLTVSEALTTNEVPDL